VQAISKGSCRSDGSDSWSCLNGFGRRRSGRHSGGHPTDRCSRPVRPAGGGAGGFLAAPRSGCRGRGRRRIRRVTSPLVGQPVQQPVAQAVDARRPRFTGQEVPLTGAQKEALGCQQLHCRFWTGRKRWWHASEHKGRPDSDLDSVGVYCHCCPASSCRARRWRSRSRGSPLRCGAAAVSAVPSVAGRPPSTAAGL